MSSKLPDDLLAGVYRHYKGPLYQVLGYAHDANAEDLITGAMLDKWIESAPDSNAPLQSLGERFVVVYIGLQLDSAHTGPRLAVRTVEDFFAPVCGVEACEQYGKAFESDPFIGCIRCKSAPVPRFEYVGSGMEA